MADSRADVRGRAAWKHRGVTALAKKTDSGDYYQTLRARFSGKAAQTRDTRFHLPADPTDQFFGAAPAGEEPETPRLFDPAGVRSLADGLSKRITAHGRAEVTLLAYGLRLAIAAFWLTLAGWYVTTTASADSSALAKLFFILAGAGAAAALFGVAMTMATGKTSKKRTREEAVLLGQRLALETHSLDHAIGRRIDTVSADAFLKSISFADASEQGADAFSSYLKRESVSAGNGAAAIFLAALLICVAVAAAIGLGADPSRLPLSDYPMALGAIIAGAGFYACAGLIASLFGQSWRARREARKEADAFATVRSAFSISHGVAPVELSARLHGGANMANLSLDEKTEPESVAAQNIDWRGRDSAPRFIETGFQMAPKAFRTDAFEKKFRP